MPGSWVWRHESSDTAPLPVGTKSVLELEASVDCTIEAGRGSGDELRRSTVQQHSAQTAACPGAVSEGQQESQSRS